VYRYINGRLELARLPEAARGLRIRTVFEDHTGAYWFGTNNQGVLRVGGGSSTRFTMADGLRNNGIQAFAADRENNVWIGTTSGISVWDGQHFRNYYLRTVSSRTVWVRAHRPGS